MVEHEKTFEIEAAMSPCISYSEETIMKFEPEDTEQTILQCWTEQIMLQCWDDSAVVFQDSENFQ